MATVNEHGDPRERKYAEFFKKHFPRYEEFWSRHVVPLRGPDGRTPAHADKDLARMAQSHYLCFVSLRLASEELANVRHAEQTFSHLQNANNRARETIMVFNQVYSACLQSPEPINHGRFGDYATRIASYRNAIHDDLLPLVVRDTKTYIPKADRLDKYKLWSAMEQIDPDDLVLLTDETNARFEELCGLIDGAWKELLHHSDTLLASAAYQQRIPKQGTIVLKQVMLSSNVTN